MTDYTVTLTMPDYIYDLARKIAEATAQPIEDVLRQQIEDAFSEVRPRLPVDEEAELKALRLLSDDPLWAIAREQLPISAKARMEVLMDGNSRGQLTDPERHELEEFVERGQRLMLRKAEAAALLTRRGYRIMPKDLSVRHG